MNISVFGLGYVGCVVSAALCEFGHRVIAVDVDDAKVRQVMNGQSPIVEAHIPKLIGQAVLDGLLSATTDAEYAIERSDVSLICVGTPSLSGGALDLQYVEKVCVQIGAAIKHKQSRHTVVIRSTVLPGTLERVVRPLLMEASGLSAADFGLVMNPEFLREGTALDDFFHPPKTVLGVSTAEDAVVMQTLYAPLGCECLVMPITSAEMVKYADNLFHATKLTFANEMGVLCKSVGADSREVMRAFKSDTKLNVSTAYLNPGFAFGGSCLPKDIRAVRAFARERGVEIPLIDSLPVSNALRVTEALRMIIEMGRKSVTVLGFSFKDGTDDLRESPIVSVIETLIGKGWSLRLYDAFVNASQLVGSNLSYADKHIPHLRQLMCATASEAVQDAELVVLGTNAEEHLALLRTMHSGQIVIDLTASTKRPVTQARYLWIAG